jgi:hypothetical protein
MLRACVIHYGTSWDKCLALAEFSYNNSYQSSLQMAPFEALYGRRCRTPLSWSETGERKIFGPDLVVEALWSLERKAMQIKEGNLCGFKWEILFISEYLLPRVFSVLA